MTDEQRGTGQETAVKSKKVIPIQATAQDPAVTADTSARQTAPSKPGDAQDSTEQLLFEVRNKIYARAVSGVFARWRWIFVWLTQLAFYGTAWLTWNGRQAVLFDLAARKFYLFGVVLYPQDFIYLTALLVISAMSLFLFTTIAGRLWCGYACPQTVYTEIFMWIERKVEGDRGKRMRLDQADMSAQKLARKSAKHLLWILFAAWTGFTFVGYFVPIRELPGQIFTMSVGPWASFWMLFYAFATWGNAGFLREQVCKYMCPYARFQGAMFDRDTLIITYDTDRGDPRGRRGKRDDPKALQLGDCIDCGLCVQVCPTGIDIRNGQQYECIGCAACIDACDQVMDKMGYAKGLVRYDTMNGMAQGYDRSTLMRRIIRPRALVYLAIMTVVSVALLGHLAMRVPLKVDVIRDRGAMYREVKNGAIENVYRLQIINSAETDRQYQLSVKGLPGIAIDSKTKVAIDAAGNRMVPVRVRVPAGIGEPGSNSIQFSVVASDDPAVAVTESASFLLPR